MPLKIDLKPFERLIINGASIRNGARKSSFLLETQCKFLRESEIVLEREADTAGKRICVSLQAIYLMEDPAGAVAILTAQILQLAETAPSMIVRLMAIQQAVDRGQHYQAIKLGRELVAYERQLVEAARATAEAADAACAAPGAEVVPAGPHRT